jgi:general secretion pathway protein H
MRTSATGRLSKPARRRHAACRASGFTLLEVLVVIVIIGIITSMAMVSVNVLGGDNEMDEEARRLMAVLTQAREDAMLEGRDVGLRVDARSYDFAHYDARMERWDLAADDPLLRERALPAGLELELWLEDRSVKLTDRAEPTDRSPLQPQVVVMASGDLIPFEIRLHRAGTAEARALVGTADGKLEILANEAVTDRR